MNMECGNCWTRIRRISLSERFLAPWRLLLIILSFWQIVFVLLNFFSLERPIRWRSPFRVFGFPVFWLLLLFLRLAKRERFPFPFGPAAKLLSAFNKCPASSWSRSYFVCQQLEKYAQINFLLFRQRQNLNQPRRGARSGRWGPRNTSCPLEEKQEKGFPPVPWCFGVQDPTAGQSQAKERGISLQRTAPQLPRLRQSVMNAN